MSCEWLCRAVPRGPQGGALVPWADRPSHPACEVGAGAPRPAAPVEVGGSPALLGAMVPHDALVRVAQAWLWSGSWGVLRTASGTRLPDTRGTLAVRHAPSQTWASWPAGRGVPGQAQLRP